MSPVDLGSLLASDKGPSCLGTGVFFNLEANLSKNLLGQWLHPRKQELDSQGF